LATHQSRTAAGCRLKQGAAAVRTEKAFIGFERTPAVRAYREALAGAAYHRPEYEAAFRAWTIGAPTPPPPSSGRAAWVAYRAAQGKWEANNPAPQAVRDFRHRNSELESLRDKALRSVYGPARFGVSVEARAR
jgi:hypothetical protein